MWSAVMRRRRDERDDLVAGLLRRTAAPCRRRSRRPGSAGRSRRPPGSSARARSPRALRRSRRRGGPREPARRARGSGARRRRALGRRHAVAGVGGAQHVVAGDAPVLAGRPGRCVQIDAHLERELARRRRGERRDRARRRRSAARAPAPLVRAPAREALAVRGARAVRGLVDPAEQALLRDDGAGRRRRCSRRDPRPARGSRCRPCRSRPRGAAARA